MHIVRSAIAVAILSAASASAFATTVSLPPSGTPAPDGALGNGGLIVNAFDATTGVSITEYLGYNAGTFAPALQTAPGTTLDFGVLGGTSGTTAFSTLFSASEVAAGNVQYTVTAANYAVGATVLTTLSKVPTTGKFTNQAIENSATAINTAVSVFNAATGCAALNPCVATNTSTDPHYLTTYIGGSLGSSLPTTAGAAGTAGGAAVQFWSLTEDLNGTPGGSTGTFVRYASSGGNATFTLSATGDLVYSVPNASAVPVPAAVWLLGSGLLGLAGVGRRKLAVAA